MLLSVRFFSFRHWLLTSWYERWAFETLIRPPEPSTSSIFPIYLYNFSIRSITNVTFSWLWKYHSHLRKILFQDCIFFLMKLSMFLGIDIWFIITCFLIFFHVPITNFSETLHKNYKTHDTILITFLQGET